MLGDHVRQAGSAVRPDKLRFDFTHPSPLTPEERTEVEQRVNERVFANLPVRIFETPLSEARNLGAMMLFGEKYGDVVRVVDVDGWSIELCGGTHVRTTAEIGPFAVLSESSVGAGSRRIEAVTAGEAFALLHERAREADALRGELERARKEAKRPGQAEQAEIVSQDKESGVVLVEVKSLKGGPLRDFSDRIRQQEKADGAIVASRDDGRVFLVVNFDESLVARGLDAVQVVRELGKHIGGGGGGKPTLAEAGGKNPDGIADALAAAKELAAHKDARVKVLALDYGSARTGVAVSDPTGTLARPLGVVERASTESGLAELARLVREEDVERVVVGLPLTLRGARGEQAAETERFVDALRVAVDVPVELYDERFTTDLARQTAGTAPEDALAAAHLLSSYLEWCAARS